MTTKQILLSTLILTTITNITLGMDNTAKNKNLEEKNFQTNIAELSKPVADFVLDFKTWPKAEQNKIKTFRNNNGRGYFIDGNLAASDKYDKNNGIGFYLDCRLTQQQITPFLDAIDYLKNQQ
jgi:hypothetical protein